MTYQNEAPQVRKITQAVQALRWPESPTKANTVMLGAQLPLYPADLIGAVSGVPIQAVIKVLAALAILEHAGENTGALVGVQHIPDNSPRGDASRTLAVGRYLQDVLYPWAERSATNTTVAANMGLFKKMRP